MTLTPGQTYCFRHRRKGEFVGEFIAEVPGDEPDPVLWHVKVATGPGSGQERLANTFVRDPAGRKVTPEFSDKQLRPSLVEEVT